MAYPAHGTMGVVVEVRENHVYDYQITCLTSDGQERVGQIMQVHGFNLWSRDRAARNSPPESEPAPQPQTPPRFRVGNAVLNESNGTMGEITDNSRALREGLYTYRVTRLQVQRHNVGDEITVHDHALQRATATQAQAPATAAQADPRYQRSRSPRPHNGDQL